MNFKTIAASIKKSKRPINADLENLQQEIYGNHRHEYYRFLYHMMMSHKPKLAIEIGVDQGLGSAHMVVAAKSYGGHVIGIDPVDNRVFDFKEYPYSFIKERSQETRKQLEMRSKLYGKVGFVFQDSDHHYESSKKEWSTISHLLEDDAVWVCDDVTENSYEPGIDPEDKGVIQYFEDLPGRKKLYDNIHEGTTVGIVLL